MHLNPISTDSKGPATLERVSDEAEDKNIADMISNLNIAAEIESKNECIQQQEQA